MIEVDAGAWRAEYERQLRNWYGNCSDVAEWVDHFVRLRLSRWDEAGDKHVFADGRDSRVATRNGDISESPFSEVDGGGLALMVVVGPPQTVQIVGCPGEAALDRAIVWAASRGGRLSVTLPPGAPAYFERLPLRATGMLKPLRYPPVVQGVTARPMTEAEYGPWLQAQLEGYVAEMVDAGFISAEQARERAETQFHQALPDGMHTAGQSFLRLEVNGDVVGTNWLGHSFEPGTSWVHGVEIGAQHRGKGYGRAAMLLGEVAAIEAGDAQIGLNVFGHNEVANRLYDSLGYRPVEVFRSIELPHASGGVPAGDQRRGQQEDPDGGSA